MSYLILAQNTNEEGRGFLYLLYHLQIKRTAWFKNTIKIHYKIEQIILEKPTEYCYAQQCTKYTLLLVKYNSLFCGMNYLGSW